MAKCKNCGNEFEGKRADAKYCSNVCRVIFNRNIPVETVTDNVTDKPKRGLNIKCFADLPPDVQQTIDRMSMVDGKLDKDEKAKRTAAAIKYQHLFPNSYESAGDLDFTRLMAIAKPGHVRVSKPGDSDYVPMCETTRRFITQQPLMMSKP